LPLSSRLHFNVSLIIVDVFSVPCYFSLRIGRHSSSFIYLCQKISRSHCCCRFQLFIDFLFIRVLEQFLYRSWSPVSVWFVITNSRTSFVTLVVIALGFDIGSTDPGSPCKDQLESGVVVQVDTVLQKSMMTMSPSSSGQLDSRLIGEDLTSDSATLSIRQPDLSQSRKKIVLTRHQLQSLLLGKPELSRLFQHPSGPKPGC